MSTPSSHGGTNVPPPISQYFSEFFSPSHIKLTDNNHDKDLNRSSDLRKSINLTENWEIYQQLVRGIRTHDLTLMSLESYPLDHKSLNKILHGEFVILWYKKNKIFFTKKQKNSWFKKISIRNTLDLNHSKSLWNNFLEFKNRGDICPPCPN